MSKREGGRRDGRRERELSVIGESPAIPPTGIAATSELETPRNFLCFPDHLLHYLTYFDFQHHLFHLIGNQHRQVYLPTQRTDM